MAITAPPVPSVPPLQSAPHAVPSRRRKEKPAFVSQAFLVLLTLAFLSPVVWALLSAFKPANDIILDPLGLT